MLTTRDLLTETMERLFGKVTVRVNRFEGKGREPLGFSTNYFCHECLRARGDTDPINSMARKRVVGMSRRVLAEKTDYDPRRFSNVGVNTFFTRGDCGGNPGPFRFRRFESEFAPFPLTSRFPFRMMRATEDWGQAWEPHRPSERPSSSRRPWSWAPTSWCLRA